MSRRLNNTNPPAQNGTTETQGGGGRQDGGQVKGHVTVDDTTRRCESMRNGAKSDLLLTERRQTADTSTSYTT